MRVARTLSLGHSGKHYSALDTFAVALVNGLSIIVTDILLVVPC